VSEPEQLICQFFVRAVSGAVALVVGTGLCYFLFIGGYLRRLEHYKERLRVYKDLDKRSARMIANIGILEREPEWVDRYSAKMEKFTKYINSEDRLFMSSGLKGQCQRITGTAMELPPHLYPEPPSIVEYPAAKILKLESEFRLLRELIENEIEATRFGVPSELVKWWSGVRRRLFG
jgi:hypothetical protein